MQCGVKRRKAVVWGIPRVIRGLEEMGDSCGLSNRRLIGHLSVLLAVSGSSWRIARAVWGRSAVQVHPDPFDTYG